MPITNCERCKREIFRSEACDYCGKKICAQCERASQRVKKVQRLVICRTCWGSMKKRGAYKNKMNPAQAVVAAQTKSEF